jgi:hypothetical protein
VERPRGQLQIGTTAQRVRQYVADLLEVAADRVEIYVADHSLEVALCGEKPDSARYKLMNEGFYGVKSTVWGWQITGSREPYHSVDYNNMSKPTEEFLTGQELLDRYAQACACALA